ncbi:MAG: hypothetical protein NTW21_40475 [Verrucomicrobia bacterium]|nr:hypothetical protein [Verrucomicrobiota bacterium]
MNPHLLLLTFTALGSLCCLAQDSPPAPVPQTAPEPVPESSKASLGTPGSDDPPTAVTIQLPPPAQPLPPVAPGPPAPATTPTDAGTSEPVPGKGTPPPVPQSPATPDSAVPTESYPSLTVQVEKLQSGNGVLDPKTVKLLAPFPAKPLAAVPSGWHLDSSTGAPPFIRKVELATGASITLNIRPHLLVPDTDGATAFAITEPGFNAALGYRQAQTVSAILATSIRQLDEDAKQLGNAIEQLQQLVSSLPQPSPNPQPPATLKLSDKR